MSDTDGFRFVYVTCANREEALTVARAAVRENLAACANVLGEITSVFEWKGQVEEDTEVSMILKTQARHLPALTALIEGLHSYECACVVALPVSANEGNTDFLQWIKSETGG